MALSFPNAVTTPINTEITTDPSTGVDRSWRPDRTKNRYDMVSDTSRSFTAEAPIVLDSNPTTNTIEHSFDIDTLTPAS